VPSRISFGTTGACDRGASGVSGRFPMYLQKMNDSDLDLLNDAVDVDFYRAHSGNADLLAAEDITPAQHYAKVGWLEGLDPSPWFNTTQYLRENPDVAQARVNPLLHYLLQGFYEGRSAAPSLHASDWSYDRTTPRLPAVLEKILHLEDSPIGSPGLKVRGTSREDSSHVVAIVAREFDADHYMQQIAQQSLDTAGLTPEEHFVHFGSAMGLDPTDWFCTKYYLESNPDVARAKVLPFYHFLIAGRDEGRPPNATASARRNDLLVIATEFDAEYYLGANPDVALAGADPLEHFVATGWHELRDPNYSFSVSDYLEMYEDVARAGINPFYHYLVAGKQEGRKANAGLGFRYKIITSTGPLREQLAEYYAVREGVFADHGLDLTETFRNHSRCRNQKVHVSFSHDDYTANLGGMQLCLRREAAGFAQRAFDHVHIFPARPLPIVDFPNSDPVLGIVFNDEFVGFSTTNRIAQALGRVYRAVEVATAAMHSLLGHNELAVTKILKSALIEHLYFWIHDYTSMCANYNLLRNDVEYCGAPPKESAACSICRFAEYRERQLMAHEQLFQSFRITAVAPSEFALQTWKSLWGDKNISTRVVPHCEIEFAGNAPPYGSDDFGRKPNSPIRIAYLGFPSTIKGWPVFRRLAFEFRNDRRYEFHHIGMFRERGVPAVFREVEVDPNSGNAMVDAIEASGIDACIVWSLTPETFCFTAHEAVCAGALLIAYNDSGNAAALARQHGISVESETALEQMLVDGTLISLAQGRKRPRFSMKFSELTASLVSGDVP
jgi:hypothetical protein